MELRSNQPIPFHYSKVLTRTAYPSIFAAVDYFQYLFSILISIVEYVSIIQFPLVILAIVETSADKPNFLLLSSPIVHRYILISKPLKSVSMKSIGKSVYMIDSTTRNP
uniref:Uncharacterized protein n=1 Tax=Aplanochytrium stocchinoi TaxID=215587 RepID=A0A7S3LH36_9STRA